MDGEQFERLLRIVSAGFAAVAAAAEAPTGSEFIEEVKRWDNVIWAVASE